MKKLITIALLLAMALPAAATILEDNQVMYLGGTAGVKEGTTGKFDTTKVDTIDFVYSGGTLPIPYAKITNFEYSRKLARHLGIAPTIAVALVKHLQRRHFFTIDYKDEKGVPQAVVFEVAKDMPQTLEAVLQARAPKGHRALGAGQTYHPCYNAGCTPPCPPNSICTQRTEPAPATGATPSPQAAAVPAVPESAASAPVTIVPRTAAPTTPAPTTAAPVAAGPAAASQPAAPAAAGTADAATSTVRNAGKGDIN